APVGRALGVRSGSDRQFDGEAGTVAGTCAVCADAAVVGFDQCAGDGQADTAAAGVAGAGGVGAVEPVEEVVEMFGGDAVSGVGDREFGAVAAGQPAADGDLAAGRGVAQRVVEQVGQDLGEPVGIDGDGGGVVDRGAQRDALRVELFTSGVDGVGDRRRGGRGNRVEVGEVCLGAGDGVDVLDESFEAVGRGAQHVPGVVVVAADVVVECFQVGVE